MCRGDVIRVAPQTTRYGLRSWAWRFHKLDCLSKTTATALDQLISRGHLEDQDHAPGAEAVDSAAPEDQDDAHCPNTRRSWPSDLPPREQIGRAGLPRPSRSSCASNSGRADHRQALQDGRVDGRANRPRQNRVQPPASRYWLPRNRSLTALSRRRGHLASNPPRTGGQQLTQRHLPISKNHCSATLAGKRSPIGMSEDGASSRKQALPGSVPSN